MHNGDSGKGSKEGEKIWKLYFFFFECRENEFKMIRFKWKVGRWYAQCDLNIKKYLSV